VSELDPFDLAPFGNAEGDRQGGSHHEADLLGDLVEDGVDPVLDGLADETVDVDEVVETLHEHRVGRFDPVTLDFCHQSFLLAVMVA